jgi:hypothetical protein
MTERQVILLATFVVALAFTLFSHNEAGLGFVIGGFLSLGWHLRRG